MNSQFFHNDPYKIGVRKNQGFSEVKGQNFPSAQGKRLKLTTLITLIAITLILVAAAIASYRVVRELLLNSSKQKALLKVEQGRQEIDRWLAVRKAEVATMADTPILATMDWQVVEPYLKSQQKRLKEYNYLVMAFVDGAYFNSNIGKVKANISDRTWFKSTIAGKVTANDPVISRSIGKEVILIGAPIGSPDQPLGVLGGGILVDRVVEVVQSLKLGQDSYAFALNSEGRVIFHPDPNLRGTQEKPAVSLLTGQDASLAAIARQMVNQQQGIELVKLNGIWRYVAYTYLQEANWSVALVILPSTIESDLDALNLLGVILGSVLIVAVVGVWQQVRLLEQAQAISEEKSQLYAQTQEQVELLNQYLLQRQEVERQLREQTKYLEQTLTELGQIQSQLIQNEKMSSLGQLVAGIAHEVNNPANFIYANLSYIDQYTQKLLELLNTYQQYYPNPTPEIIAQSEAIELEFLRQDLLKLVASMKVGSERIRDIVKSLRNFARLDESELKEVDIHEGINNTLMILQHRLNSRGDRPNIQVVTEYSQLPLVYCYAGQLNQVFLNIINNAIDALDECDRQAEICRIKISTSLDSSEQIKICIADNGVGMTEEVKKRLFDPFFTTKPVGKGTGMGLSISYQIITKRHQGKLWCVSEAGQGTEFWLEIPIFQ